jgi:hypothetical protein
MKNTLWYILNDNIEVSLYVDDFLIYYLEENIEERFKIYKLLVCNFAIEISSIQTKN